MARESRARCPICKTIFSIPSTAGIGAAKVSCPNQKCRVRLEVEIGFPGLMKAKWVGPSPGIAKRGTA